MGTCLECISDGNTRQLQGPQKYPNGYASTPQLQGRQPPLVCTKMRQLPVNVWLQNGTVTMCAMGQLPMLCKGGPALDNECANYRTGGVEQTPLHAKLSFTSLATEYDIFKRYFGHIK